MYDRPQEFETNAPPAKRGKKGGGRGANKAQGSGASHGPTDVDFKARIELSLEAGKCGACGMAGHRYKNEAGEKTCPNLRNPAPHATITKAVPKAKQG